MTLNDFPPDVTQVNVLLSKVHAGMFAQGFQARNQGVGGGGLQFFDEPKELPVLMVQCGFTQGQLT